jgi:hypothetical protein
VRYAVAIAPRPHPRIVESRLGDDTVLFHLDARRLHVLNGSAAAIWEELHEVHTVGEVAVRLGDRFDVAAVDIRPDIERTIEQMRADGILWADDRPPATPRGRRSVHPRPGTVDLPATGCYRALDARLGVVCDAPEVAAIVDEVLAPLRSAEPPDVAITIEPTGEETWRVTVGGREPVVLGSRLAVALRTIGEVNDLAVASVPDHLVLHAGAVAIDGRGVLLPGGSNHGKSTLTTALVTDGAAYLTDEAAAITDELTIRPFPKSIALDPGSFPLFPGLGPDAEREGLARAVAGREWHVHPERVGSIADTTPVSVVVCPHWRAGVATRVTPVEPVEALHLLLGDAFDFTQGAGPVFDRLVRLVATVPVVRVSYSDSAAAMAAVHDVLADHT